MSVILYDNAFVEKLRSWTKDTAVSILTPQDTKKLFSMIADGNNDKTIELPLISLKRTGGYSVTTPSKQPLSFDGAKLDATYKLSKQLRAIPISIPYQLDIYTRYQEEADEYVRNLVYNIINYPKLDINIPYHDENYIHHSNIRMSGQIDDNSDIPERLVSGQFVRMTMAIEIDDAYLFDIRFRDVKHVETVVTTEVLPQTTLE